MGGGSIGPSKGRLKKKFFNSKMMMVDGRDGQLTIKGSIEKKIFNSKMDLRGADGPWEEGPSDHRRVD